MSTFGDIVTDDMVEDAVVAHLKAWLPTYLAEVEGQSMGQDKRGFYKRPPEGSYVARTDFDKWPEDDLPMVMVISPGIEDDPVKTGGVGRFRARFQIGIICVVSSSDELATRRYAYRMGSAVRAVMLQKSSLGQALGGKVRGVQWIGTRNNEVADVSPEAAERSLWANRQLFVIEVDGILIKGGGPPEPGMGPFPDDPVVSSTHQQLEHIHAE